MVTMTPAQQRQQQKKEEEKEDDRQSPSTASEDRNTARFEDQSTECAICLSDLKDHETITLSCGHRWHLHCLKDQLRHAQPDTSRRLLFHGCRCAKCGDYCDHPELDHLTRKTDALREQVHQLVVEQLQVDRPKEWKQAVSGNTRAGRSGSHHQKQLTRQDLIELGQRTYAFYLCASCQEPYFGGTVECADQRDGERQASNDRFCTSCSPQLQQQQDQQQQQEGPQRRQRRMLCDHPQQHRGFHVWKCRYCCQPSSFVCYGTVHFCTSCHDRNTRRVRRRESAPLQPIPCAGSDCCFPKPRHQQHHTNGATPDCEQVYHCAWCVSRDQTTASAQREQQDQHRRSPNLIYNPSGEYGLRGWQALTSAATAGRAQQRSPPMWHVEQSEIPLDPATRTNFVSSFQWCAMEQAVPLPPAAAAQRNAICIEVGCHYMARTDCPSVFVLQAQLLNQRGAVLQSKQTGLLRAPSDFWETATLTFDIIPHNATHVNMAVYGKDERFWQGNFGSKVTACSVRIVGADGIEWEHQAREANFHPQQERQREAHFTMMSALAVLFIAWWIMNL